MATHPWKYEEKNIFRLITNFVIEKENWMDGRIKRRRTVRMKRLREKEL